MKIPYIVNNLALFRRKLVALVGFFNTDARASFLGLVVSVILGCWLTQGSLVNLFDHFGQHQTVNAWKIYQIDKNKLNPFYYDVKLKDLSGGRFVSYWDTPLPYFLSLVFSKILTPLGDFRYLAAIKLVTLLNIILSYLAFYALLRVVGVKSRLISALVPIAFFAHRFCIFNLYSVNMPGYWALTLPLILVIRISKGDVSSRAFALLGLSIALALLQNPYYGVFVSFLVLVPIGWKIVSHLVVRRQFKILFFASLALVCILFPVAILKGRDIYKIQTNKIPDPQGRNYLTKKSSAYRFWYHFIPPSGHKLSGYVNKVYTPVRNWLFDKEYIDGITLWNPDGNNIAYLGYANILAIVVLLIIGVKKGFLKVIKKAWPFGLSLFIGSLVFFVGDVFVFGSHHIAFPWYRIQAVLPLQTLSYYSVCVLIYSYVFLGILFDRVFPKEKKGFIFLSLLLLWTFVAIFDTKAGMGSAGKPELDSKFVYYLAESPNKKRLSLQIGFVGDSEINPALVDNPVVQSSQIRFDGRYYQIFHGAKIFATDSLSWLDSYQYDEETMKIRNLKTILTDKNARKLKDYGIDEIILYVSGISGDKYWQRYLKPQYRSTKEVLVFDSGLVFKT